MCARVYFRVFGVDSPVVTVAFHPSMQSMRSSERSKQREESERERERVTKGRRGKIDMRSCLYFMVVLNK